MRPRARFYRGVGSALRRGRGIASVIGVMLSIVALGGLLLGAARGGRTVEGLRARVPVDNAKLDDAFYRCIDVQAHSVVVPDEPVVLDAPDFGSYIVLLKAVGSWVAFTPGPSKSAVQLWLIDRPGPGSCLGKVVVARKRQPDGSVETLVGTGASVPGRGPPPATPL